MELKKTAQISQQEMRGRKMIEYFGSLKQEFRNVAWTPKHELIAYTKIVAVATFIFGMLIYLTDLVIQGVLNSIGLITKLFGG